ncbi:MAG: hypothetical protein ACOCUT_03795, partial [bacterium]
SKAYEYCGLGYCPASLEYSLDFLILMSVVYGGLFFWEKSTTVVICIFFILIHIYVNHFKTLDRIPRCKFLSVAGESQ